MILWEKKRKDLNLPGNQWVWGGSEEIGFLFEKGSNTEIFTHEIEEQDGGGLKFL